MMNAMSHRRLKFLSAQFSIEAMSIGEKYNQSSLNASYKLQIQTTNDWNYVVTPMKVASILTMWSN